MSDSFRRAAKVSDEQVLFLREQLTAAHAAIEKEQAERRAERAGYVEEIAHLRQGIDLYHADYRASCSLLGDCKSPEVEAWRDRDRNRAEGRQLSLTEGGDGR